MGDFDDDEESPLLRDFFGYSAETLATARKSDVNSYACVQMLKNNCLTAVFEICILELTECLKYCHNNYYEQSSQSYLEDSDQLLMVKIRINISCI